MDWTAGPQVHGPAWTKPTCQPRSAGYLQSMRRSQDAGARGELRNGLFLFPRMVLLSVAWGTDSKRSATCQAVESALNGPSQSAAQDSNRCDFSRREDPPSPLPLDAREGSVSRCSALTAPRSPRPPCSRRTHRRRPEWLSPRGPPQP